MNFNSNNTGEDDVRQVRHQIRSTIVHPHTFYNLMASTQVIHLIFSTAA